MDEKSLELFLLNKLDDPENKDLIIKSIIMISKVYKSFHFTYYVFLLYSYLANLFNSWIQEYKNLGKSSEGDLHSN